MQRRYSTDKNGQNWSEETKRLVWNKGRVIPDYSSDIWRWDKCGLVLNWSQYGNRDSENGWEIDHINPVSNGGGDNIENLQPLNWKNNAEKGDKINWNCH